MTRSALCTWMLLLASVLSYISIDNKKIALYYAVCLLVLLRWLLLLAKRNNWNRWSALV
jgi:hypothetical protein